MPTKYLPCCHFRSFSTFWTVLVLFGLLPLLAYARPVNDDFADALVLRGTFATAQGSTEHATSQHYEVGERTVWWKWTAPTNGYAVLDSQGSASGGAKLNVYTGSQVSALSFVASNGYLANTVGFSAQAGVTYRIDVSSFALDGPIALALRLFSSPAVISAAPESVECGLVSGTGTFQPGAWTTLHAEPNHGYTFSGWTLDGTKVSTKSDYYVQVFDSKQYIADFAVCPANDDFSQAAVLSGTSASAMGSNVHATKEPGEPSPAYGRGTTSIWWRWTAPKDGLVCMQVGGDSFHRDMGVYTGTAVNALTQIFSHCGQGEQRAQFYFAAVSGQTYYLAVTGDYDECGEITVNLDMPTGAVPVTIFCDPVGAGSVITTGTFEMGQTVTLEAQPNPGFHFKGWSREMSLDYFVSKTTNVAYSFLVVEPVILKANFAAIPSNDNFADATVLSGTILSVRESATEASREAGEPSLGDGYEKTIWWEWTAPSAGTALITTVPWDISLAVYTGTTVQQLLKVADSQDGSGYLTFPVEAGVTYKIAAASYSTWDILFDLKLLSGFRTVSVSGGSAQGTLSGSGTFEVGAIVSVKAVPNPGFRFVSWQSGGRTVSYGAEYSFQLLGNEDLVALYAPCPLNDEFANRTELSGVVVDGNGSTVGASSESGEFASDTIWWKWTAPASGLVTVTCRGSNFYPDFAVFTGDDFISLQEIADNNDFWGDIRSVSFRTQAGTTYSIQVAGNSPGGDVTLHVRLKPDSDPIMAMAGEYDGLTADTGLGAIRLKLAPTHDFTGQLVYNGRKARFVGRFDKNGRWTGPVPSLGVELALELGLAGRDELTGSMSFQGSPVTSLVAKRAIRANALAGTYTVVLQEPGAPIAGHPFGTGWATLQVLSSGKAVFAGRLGDGTAFSYVSRICAGGYVPFHLRAYNNTGAVSGWIQFRDVADVSDLDGTLKWTKPLAFYPDGFEASLHLVGSRFVAPQNGGPLLNFSTSGSVDFSTRTHPTPWESEFVFNGEDASFLNGNVYSASLHFSGTNGTFTGSFIPEGASNPVSLSGVILQKQNSAAGQFEDGSETGDVEIFETK